MIKIFNHFIPRIASLLFLTELLCLLGSPYIAAGVRFSDDGYRFIHDNPNFGASAIAYALVMSFCMAVFGMYHLTSRQSMYDSMYRFVPAFILGMPIVIVLYYLLPELYLGRGILALSVLISALSISMIRVLVGRCFTFSLLRSRVIFVGDTSFASKSIELASTTRFRDRYEIVGFFPLADADADAAHSGAAVSAKDMSLTTLARKHNVDEIVIAAKDWRAINIPIYQLLECRVSGVAVSTVTGFFERETNQININYLRPSSLVFGDGFNHGLVRTAVKRAVDLIASVLLLVLTLPVMLVTMIGILLEDGGPILYRQERVGKNGKPFMVLKFRSMRTDAEKAGSPQWAQVGDPRVTRIGRLIRKTRIDELPQLFNVLRGEMSFVGPRPERPYFVKQLCEQIPFYDMRHSIKPGLTGFAQVRYQYGSTVEDAVEKLQYDLYYLKNHSLFLDLLIIVDTFQVVLFAKGSR